MNIKHLFQRNKFIVILLFVTFILRLPSLFEPYWYGDEGIYLAIGMAIKRGFLLYRDVFDNKPPLVYLVAALCGGVQFWFKFFLTVSLLSTIYVFYRFSQKVLEKEKSAKIATICLSFFTTIRAFEGNIVNSELLILLPTVVGFYLSLPILKLTKENKTSFSNLRLLLIGILFSLSFLYKVPGLFDFVTLMLLLTFFILQNKLINLNKRTIILLLGYLSLIVGTGIFFFFKGAFNQFFQSSFVQTFGYLSSWKTGTHSFSLVGLLKTDLAIKTILVTLILFCLWIKRRYSNPTVNFLTIWFIFSLYGATLSGRPYPHYLVQIILPLSLIIGYYSQRRAKTVIALGFFFSLLLILSLVKYRFWTYTTIPYYQNFITFILGKKNKNSYYSYFGSQVPISYKIAEIVIVNSDSNDKIFVWGNEPYLYPLTKRLPATAYLVSYHIIDLNYYDKVALEISKERPKIIVYNINEKKFPQLENILANYYQEIDSVGNFLIFSKLKLPQSDGQGISIMRFAKYRLVPGFVRAEILPKGNTVWYLPKRNNISVSPDLMIGDFPAYRQAGAKED